MNMRSLGVIAVFLLVTFVLSGCWNSSPPSPNFTLSLNPTSLSVPQGGSGTPTLTLTPQNGFTGTVTLSLQGAPSGVTLSPTSVNVTGSSPVTQTLTLAVASSVPQGTYPLTLQATSGSLTKTVNLSLTVTTPSNENLFITKVEWGQSVLKETLRLVAGKEALLRVHLVASPDPISLSTPLSGAVYAGGTFRGNLTFTCPSPLPTATLQGDLTTTCRATLPASWVAPDLRVELLADPNNQVAETNEADNARTLTPEVGAGTVLHLTLVPVVHQGVTATVPSFSETLLAVWPLKDVNYTTRAPYTYAGTLSATDGSSWSDLLEELKLLRQADGSGRYYYGFVRVGYTSGIAGIGYLGFPVAVGWDYASSAPAVMAHELGHNFGREHAPCGVSGDPNYPYANGSIGTWGYDRRNGSLKDPSTYRDLMSYCSPLWISDYTYEGAQGFLEANPPRPQSLTPLGSEENLLFTALVADGRVRLRPPLLGPFRPEGRPSSYRLEADGVSYPVYALEDSEGHLHLEALIPVGTYRRLALYEGSRLLLERTAPLTPQAAPQVDLREEGEEVAVRVQGGTHFHLAHLAPDGTRTTLALFHPTGEARFSIRGLPPGGRYEVQVTEGLRVVRFLRP
ncbi:hypothetical protein Thermus77923_22170 [Thermus oshimai]